MQYIYLAAAVLAAISLAALAWMRIYDELRFRRCERLVETAGRSREDGASVTIPAHFAAPKRRTSSPGSATKRAEQWINNRVGPDKE